MTIVMLWVCWTCGKEHENEAGCLALPPGWTEARRGFAGVQAFCSSNCRKRQACEVK